MASITNSDTDIIIPNSQPSSDPLGQETSQPPSFTISSTLPTTSTSTFSIKRPPPPPSPRKSPNTKKTRLNLNSPTPSLKTEGIHQHYQTVGVVKQGFSEQVEGLKAIYRDELVNSKLEVEDESLCLQEKAPEKESSEEEGGMSVDQDGINLSSDEWMDYRLPDLESEKGHEEIVVVEGEILPPGRIFSLRQLLELDETELENLCMIWNVESYFTREQKATSVSYKMLKALEEDNLRLLSSLEIDGDGMESEGGDDGNMSDVDSRIEKVLKDRSASTTVHDLPAKTNGKATASFATSILIDKYGDSHGFSETSYYPPTEVRIRNAPKVLPPSPSTPGALDYGLDRISSSNDFPIPSKLLPTRRTQLYQASRQACKAKEASLPTSTTMRIGFATQSGTSTIGTWELRKAIGAEQSFHLFILNAKAGKIGRLFMRSFAVFANPFVMLQVVSLLAPSVQVCYLVRNASFWTTAGELKIVFDDFIQSIPSGLTFAYTTASGDPVAMTSSLAEIFSTAFSSINISSTLEDEESLSTTSAGVAKLALAHCAEHWWFRTSFKGMINLLTDSRRRRKLVIDDDETCECLEEDCTCLSSTSTSIFDFSHQQKEFNKSPNLKTLPQIQELVGSIPLAPILFGNVPFAPFCSNIQQCRNTIETTAHGVQDQRCRKCSRHFADNPGYEWPMKSETETIDLYRGVKGFNVAEKEAGTCENPNGTCSAIATVTMKLNDSAETVELCFTCKQLYKDSGRVSGTRGGQGEKGMWRDATKPRQRANNEKTAIMKNMKDIGQTCCFSRAADIGSWNHSTKTTQLNLVDESISNGHLLCWCPACYKFVEKHKNRIRSSIGEEEDESKKEDLQKKYEEIVLGLKSGPYGTFLIPDEGATVGVDHFGKTYPLIDASKFPNVFDDVKAGEKLAARKEKKSAASKKATKDNKAAASTTTTGTSISTSTSSTSTSTTSTASFATSNSNSIAATLSKKEQAAAMEVQKEKAADQVKANFASYFTKK